jgi:DNA-binding MarR family transcriptional regulator
MRLKRKSRVRKLTLKQRNLICELYKSGDWTMKELSEQFDVSIPRVSQIVNNYYGELVQNEE